MVDMQTALAAERLAALEAYIESLPEPDRSYAWHDAAGQLAALADDAGAGGPWPQGEPRPEPAPEPEPEPGEWEPGEVPDGWEYPPTVEQRIAAVEGEVDLVADAVDILIMDSLGGFHV